ncbi:MAG: hypothetical protein H6Q37_442, partial [Chloroflexi bacterium]|nr:hypothetical protein [Chloroflexota bacterium]
MAAGNRDNKPDQAAFVVRGTVSYIDGSPAAGLLVQAFDRDLRNEQVLGKAQTDGKGFYEIRYTTDQFARAEKANADLLVRVYNAAGQVLYDPGLDGVQFNAPPEALINILLNFGQTGLPSEYERLLRDVQPLLLDVKLPDLREDEEARDITFLTRETGWATDILNYLVVAFRLQVRSQIDPDFFYALLRQGMPLQNDLRAAVEAGFAITVNSDLQGVFYSLVLIDEAILRKAVEKSIRESIVPPDLAKRLAGAIKQLKSFQDQAQAYFREEQSRKLFNLVQTNLASGKVEEFVHVFQQDAFSDLTGFFDRLGSVGILSTPQDVKRVKAQSAVADVLGFDQHILGKVMAIKKIHQPEDIGKLAELNPSEWRKLLKESSAEIQPPGTKLDDRLIRTHASKLARNLEKRFPSEAFNAQILRDKKNDLPYAGPLRQTLKKEPDFNLLKTNIDTHFSGDQLAQLSKENPQAAKEQLKAAQRIFKVAPTYRQANA